ncbi:MAG: Branched-chain-amino-acid aminotransferase [Fimbriimonadales bacterium]|nr:MAG: branched-chain-amino-acid transaminase [Armatimonadota bacterium]MBV6502751.1 Branched-chain-amino-acid aminotransferase [Fimbriimonadales bacterium]MCE7900124.1 branched-chain-amino-acid transaminase [Armatimonadetes bacterium ATM1]MDL1929425.1 branched-chain-amino-acid transaminase [Fimbriimonadia bacterium ATM]MBC6968995.1 branched-chain-amino-acid transaminase [Armatimonadota bacterium]
MPPLVWFNGELQELDKAVIPAGDHAHLYGDGLFEGIRIYNRKVFKLDEHLTRLYDGARYLHFEMKVSQSELRDIVLDTCRKAGQDNGYIRINVTRGTGLGLDPKNISRTPNIMVMVNKLALYPPEAYDTGLTTILCSTRVFPAQCLDPRLKTIGRYVANIYAKTEANRQGAGEGLMLNTEGYLAEATGDNVFLVRRGVLHTPHPSCGILGGITRQTVIDLARKNGIEVREEYLTIYDVSSADEAFLTGTAAEVIPMVALDGRPIGCGTPGKMTQEIIAMFREQTAEGTEF